MKVRILYWAPESKAL